MAKVGLIWVWPHSKRIYLPFLMQLEKIWLVSLDFVIELESKKEEITNLLANHQSEKVFIPKFYWKIPNETSKVLSDTLKKTSVDGVIIATEPTVHYAYSSWAIDNNLHVLLDKPIIWKDNIVNDLSIALSLYDEYIQLKQKYENSKWLFFWINTQRRYHPWFTFVNQYINEIKERTWVPITHINSFHSDWQRRLPNEIVTQDYHPYNSWYWKASHSGYHLFDFIWKLIQEINYPILKPDKFRLYSNALFPNGFLKQIPLSFYESYFWNSFKKVNSYSEDQLSKLYWNYWEMDCFTNIAFERDWIDVLHVLINMLHNSCAMRDRVIPWEDLYKWNGRVKHESHTINQWPFQSIQIHSYQSNDKHDENSIKDYSIWGNNHFEINIFRNSRILWWKSLESYNIKDVLYTNNPQQLLIEEVKKWPLMELINYIHWSYDLWKSNLLTHDLWVRIMSWVYQSLCAQKKWWNQIITNQL